MKKEYKKPELLFDSFELSMNIAAGCEKKTHTLTDGTCGVIVDGIGMVFFESITGCTYKGADGDYSICYHNPEDNANLFNS